MKAGINVTGSGIVRRWVMVSVVVMVLAAIA
jgi:hypothetical protein